MPGQPSLRVSGEHQAVDAVRETLPQSSSQIAVLMNPTRIEQVIETARGGDRLPQKSTYFYPKVLTGLVFDRPE